MVWEQLVQFGTEHFDEYFCGYILILDQLFKDILSSGGHFDHGLGTVCAVYAGLPRSGKKFWKKKNVPGQGKVRKFHCQSGKFRTNEKSHGKVREFQKFQNNC